MASETKTINVHISEIMFWVVLIVFLVVMAWWVLGDSPTTEMIGVTLSVAGLYAAWRGSENLEIIRANTFKTIELLEKLDSKIK